MESMPKVYSKGRPVAGSAVIAPADIAVLEPQPQPVVRSAGVADVPQIAELVAYYAHQRDLLPRSMSDIYQSVREWVVAEIDGEIVACGSLLIMWADLAEVRSIAVKSGWQGHGLGQAVVLALVEEARRLGIPTVFCLTRAVPFFARLGFTVTERDRFPRKVWKDCIHCPVFANCDEVAMVLPVTRE